MTVNYCGDPAKRLTDRVDHEAELERLLAQIRVIVGDGLSGEATLFGALYEIDKLIPVEHYRNGGALDG